MGSGEVDGCAVDGCTVDGCAVVGCELDGCEVVGCEVDGCELDTARAVSVSASSAAEGDGRVAPEVVCAADDAVFSDVDGSFVISDKSSDAPVASIDELSSGENGAVVLDDKA